jgi:hypothetical protein
MGGDGTNVWQVPDHIADTRQRLDDRDGVPVRRPSAFGRSHATPIATGL